MDAQSENDPQVSTAPNYIDTKVCMYTVHDRKKLSYYGSGTGTGVLDYCYMRTRKWLRA